ncbi:hypothetical protein PISL3812_01134 [Talaromyces islandicus]|uniref:GH16 domain-containing protein n=1 Tax=Talaromyces islandicus TaxID=28573 RepID=A0A0U1LLA0_TALIS|nr:hypothetical protein PISL3812_01134 [Talaromyces islandicus]
MRFTFFPILAALALVPAMSSTKRVENPPSMSQDRTQTVDAGCDCYTVSGPDPGYFQHHRFWDFRQVPLNPAAASTFRFQPNSPPSPDYGANAVPVLLKDTPFSSEWAVQDWGRGGTPLFPVTIVNSNKNAYLTRHTAGGQTFLAMRTTRFETFSSTAEIETNILNFIHVSMRVRLRILDKGEDIMSPRGAEQALGQRIQAGSDDIPAPEPNSPAQRRNENRLLPPFGACVGIFTFFSRTSESDIEILTSDPPNRVHYANQPDYDPIRNIVIPGSQIAADAPIPWTAWSTYRLDWLPTMSRWYVENQQQASLAYGVPVDPSRLVINLWSDGGLWSGNLTVGDSVHLGIEWIELAYNLTGDVSKPCNRNCRVDNVAVPGIPEVI